MSEFRAVGDVGVMVLLVDHWAKGAVEGLGAGSGAREGQREVGRNKSTKSAGSLNGTFLVEVGEKKVEENRTMGEPPFLGAVAPCYVDGLMIREAP